MEHGWREASRSAAGRRRFWNLPANPIASESAGGLTHSKTWRLLVAALVMFGAAVISHAQSYSIDWFKIAGGGGISTGGVYCVSGTIGQPDAGRPMTNGQYAVVGGFWGVLGAVQTPGAPTLTVTRTATNTVAVSWPLPDGGWKLQATTQLVAGGSVWIEIPPPYSTNATSLFCVEPAPVGNKFYRLHKP